MNEKIQVLIVDDHPMFREGVVHALSLQQDLEVVGEAASGPEALRLTRELLPDVVLLDISIPGSGLAAAASISQAFPVVKIVMLTASEQEDDVLAAFKAGARGYVLKGVSAREMAGIIRSVHEGESYVTPALAASLLSELAGGQPRRKPVEPMDELTDREKEILELVAAGQSNKEIGRQLFLTEKTVKHYMTNILQKLQVRNRVEAALLAQKAGGKL